jgi:hypothetical protein
MSISNNELIWALIIAVLLAGSLAFIFYKQRKEAKLGAPEKKDQVVSDVSSRQLQLQAYERLMLLCDRISLNNIVTRISNQGLTAKDMQTILTHSIRQEFEHNITQQIYVSPEAWEAVRNFKEQNLLIINQVSSFLPADASGLDLSKSLLELLSQNPKASLHNVVAEALSFEAKKLMK